MAFLRLDEREVPAFTVVNHSSQQGKAEVTRYPKAGTVNPKVSVGVVDVSRMKVQWIDLKEFGAPEQILVVRLSWTPTGDQLILEIQDRIQTWLQLAAFDVDRGKLTRLIREQSDV